MSQQSNAKFQQRWKVINYSLRFTPNTTDGDFRKEERQRAEGRRKEGERDEGHWKSHPGERSDLTYIQKVTRSSAGDPLS